jgi:transcriptional regulator with XRE-family HTH domain
VKQALYAYGMTSKDEIGQRIRSAREEAGMTQGELGRAWGGKSHAAVSDVERGATHVTASSLAELAKILGKDVGYFFGEKASAQFLRGGRDETGTIVNASASEEFKRFLREQKGKSK